MSTLLRAQRASVLMVPMILVLLAATPALADLKVNVNEDKGLIGKDITLELILPPTVGSDPTALTTEVTPTLADTPPLFDEAVRLRSTGEPGHYTLTLTSLRSAVPGDHPVRIAVVSGDQQHVWEGTLSLDYGKEWTAERITYFIANRGLVLFLALVFLGGILMSATPCIYPMIPITLAVIGAQTQEKGVGKGFILALTYGLGLALVYGIIGLVSATIFSGITAFLQSPVVLVPIALLMVALSFAMFGAYELEAPAFLRNRLQGAGGGKAGLLGALVAGMVAGLVASPCVGPFLAALLVWVGTTGKVLLGFSSLFIFGLGLSALLVAVGTFPSLMSSMPQSGGWMETVKKGMGLLLLYMAFFFVRPPLVLPASIFYPLLGVVTIIVASFMGAFDRLAPDSHWWPRARTGLGVVVLLVGIWLLGRQAVPQLLPAPQVITTVPAMTAGPTAAAAGVAAAPLPEKVQWEIVHTGESVMDFIDAKIAEAGAAGKPVVIDFWASWCVYCKKLDKTVWSDPDVVRESLRYVTIKVDATKADDADMMAVKERFNVPGLPTVAFIDSQGNHQKGKSFNGYKAHDEVLELMRSIDSAAAGGARRAGPAPGGCRPLSVPVAPDPRSASPGGSRRPTP
ncbi:MAG: cytochrome c biogenesis protein CcdA [Candidatus Krumholzibacteriia bacterium]